MNPSEYLVSQTGQRLAYRHHKGTSQSSCVWLSGFTSDMAGTKVLALEAWAKDAGHGFTAFD